MKNRIKLLSMCVIIIAAGIIACGGGGGGSEGSPSDPAALAENYSRIATAYANALSSATETEVDNSNEYHIVTTLKNSDGSVKLMTGIFMDSGSVIQGIQGTYIFNNYNSPNGVILTGTLEYYTTGTGASVFILQGTITATGAATGSYTYKIRSDNGTISGYAGISGYYYNYSTGSITYTEPSYTLPAKPAISYYTPGLSYTLINGGTEYSVSRGTANTTSGVCIPGTWNGKPVTSISDNAFKDWDGLKEVVIPSGIKNIGNNAFNSTGLTTIIIPGSVTSIGGNAFQYCKFIGNINIPDGVIIIGSSAFSSCGLIMDVNIPASVTSIGSGAFKGFIGNIIVASGNPSYKSISGVLFNKAGTVIMQMSMGMGHAGNYSIPAGVITINDSAFEGCLSLTGVIIPGSVTTIGKYAFSQCDGLTNIIIPAGVTTIGENAFNCCYSLTDITIYAVTPPATDSTIFNVCPILTSIKVPSGSVAVYQTATGWSSYAGIIVSQ